MEAGVSAAAVVAAAAVLWPWQRRKRLLPEPGCTAREPDGRTGDGYAVNDSRRSSACSDMSVSGSAQV